MMEENNHEGIKAEKDEESLHNDEVPDNESPEIADYEEYDEETKAQAEELTENDPPETPLMESSDDKDPSENALPDSAKISKPAPFKKNSVDFKESQKQLKFRRKVCRFCTDKNYKVNYKDPTILGNYITERGKILPRRITGVCSRHQREVSRAIKRARILAVLPFTVK